MFGGGRYFVLYHLRTAAFVAVGVAAIFVVIRLQTSTTQRLEAAQRADSAKIVASQINACARGNILRAAVNADTNIIQYFMRELTKAANQRGGRDATQRAQVYSALASVLVKVPIPDCARVVYHP